MAPHHAAWVAHKAAKLDHRAGVGLIEVAPGGALIPGGHRASDRSFVQLCRALQQPEFDLRLHGTREHQGIVAVDHRHCLKREPEAYPHVVKSHASPIKLKILEGSA